jgi:hypothetical protein
MGMFLPQKMWLPARHGECNKSVFRCAGKHSSYAGRNERAAVGTGLPVAEFDGVQYAFPKAELLRAASARLKRAFSSTGFDRWPPQWRPAAIPAGGIRRIASREI